MDTQEKYHLTQLAKGSKESFTFLFKKYRSKVYCYCFKFVRSKEVAQEITIDVFMKTWEKHAIIKADYPLNNLLFKIARDLSINYLRKAAKDVRLRKEFVENYLHAIEHASDEKLLLKEGLQIAKQAIDSLPPRCRQVFHLRYVEDFSLKQIAEELDISLSTVKKQLKKGTVIVKTYLKTHADLAFALILGQYF